MENDKMRVACYARYSTNMQREESIAAQIRAMRNYCEVNGWTIIRIYVDEAKSATTDRRPNFQKMIADSSKKEFDIVLVHKLDRFSRNRYDSAIYKYKLRKNNVRLCSVLERIDDTPESIILESMLEGFSEYYSANLAREVMKGLKENALQCRHTGGSAPLGYDVDEEGHLVINEYEAEAVRMIYEMYNNGYGYDRIADALNENGYITKNGVPFKTSSFRCILQNEKYTGTYIFNRTASKDMNHKRNSGKLKPADQIIRIEGGCPAIISEDLFRKTQQRLKNNRKAGCIQKAGAFYLASGKVYCGICGKRMYGSERYQPVFFHCYVCHSKKAVCSNYKEIDQEKLDDYLVVLLKRKLFNKRSMYSKASMLSETERSTLLETFATLDKKDVPFRTFIQPFVKTILVYRTEVEFVLDFGFCETTLTKKYIVTRELFRTPAQKRKQFT